MSPGAIGLSDRELVVSETPILVKLTADEASAEGTNANRKAKGRACAGRKLVGYRGKWYDVTDFIDKHPGGEVISLLVGQDATELMDGWHRLDVVKHRKPVGTYKVNFDAFGRDMTKLEMKLRREGYYDNSFWWCFRKCIQTLITGLISIYLAASGLANGGWFWLVTTGLLMALFWQQSGMLMHDYMHSQFTRKRIWDERVGVFFGTICFGISSRWWKEEHIIHHSMTNTVDLRSGFVDPQAMEDTWAQNEKLFPFHQSKLHSFFITIQHLTFLPLALGVGRIGIIIDSMREERRLDVWISWLVHNAWVAYFLTRFSSWKTALLVYGIGCLGEGVLHVQLLLNHYSKRFFDLNEKLNMNHYLAMIECNMNIVCPRWMDWFHGGLNFHHEHHCFPRLPRNRLREVSCFIQEICARHNVHYDQCCFFEALGKTLYNLYLVRNKFIAKQKES